MTNSTSEIAQILLHCEENGNAPPYVYLKGAGESTDIYKSEGAIVPLASRGGDVFVVSDLHLAAGKGRDGRYDGCENFFSDAAFRRFLLHARERPQPPTLIINGDFIDFLRVTYVPGRPGGMTRWQRILTQLKLRRRSRRVKSLRDDEKAEFLQDFVEWQQILEKVGISRRVDELVESINDKEELYGLRTNDYKSVLRLDIAIKGHPEFFAALAEWLAAGNRLIVVKGNHDLEWYWLAVRNYLRLDLAQRIAQQQAASGDLKAILRQTVLPNVTFIDHAMVIDDEFYVEHGHPYDALTRVIGEATVNDDAELNIPFGSFFNRYLLNYIELQYPFLDNIRPTPNMLPLMLRDRFFTGLRLLYDHLSVIVKTVPRRYVKWIFGQHIIGRVLLILLVVIVPPIMLLIYQISNPPSWELIVFEWLAVFASIYFVIQALSYAQLKEPDSLAQFARRRLDENHNYRLVTFGHTHNPDQFEDGGRWFYNTGTWIPIVEATSSDVRVENTFMFLHLAADAAGKLEPRVLQRWDDEANRVEAMVIIRRANP